MIIEAVGQKVLSRLTDAVVEKLSDKLSTTTEANIVVQTGSQAKSIRQHLELINRWASEIAFRELQESKSLRESFVDLDLYLGTLRHSQHPEENAAFRVSELLDVPGHIVLLGDPGAGKTTSLKRVALKALDIAGKTKSTRIPVLVRLREFGSADSLVNSLLTVLGVSVHLDEVLDARHKRTILSRILLEQLDRLQPCILIDGLDELNPTARSSVVVEIQDLFLQLATSKVILTCRTGDYRYQLEQSRTLVISPLSDNQIRQFTIRWLGKDKAPDFVSKVQETPYGGAEVRPLTLAHLCAIYERSGNVPDKPRAIYRKIVRLLLEEWDEQRLVRRYSQYADFTVDRKEEFLEALAFHLTDRFNLTSFSHSQLSSAYGAIHRQFSLPSTQAEKVVREIESHTGIIVEVAHEHFEFAHKSIQEYLTSSYVLKLPEIPRDKLFRLPNETALSVAMSSFPSKYFITVVRATTKLRVGLADFTEPFLRRLMIEKVDLVPSPELGFATLALYSSTYFPEKKAQLLLTFGTPEANFHPFIVRGVAGGVVRDAIREALENARLNRVKDSKLWHVVPRIREPGGFMSPIIVDTELLTLVGWYSSTEELGFKMKKVGEDDEWEV